MVAKFFSQLVAMMLLVTLIAAGAGAFCVLSAATHPAMAECHPSQMPSHPQPADYRCCLSRHAVPLVTNVVSPRPVLEAVEAQATPVLVGTRDGPEFFPSIAPSSRPPGIVVLRI
jgi:hypothetical protein